MSGLLKSRRFWVGVFGAVATLLVYFIGKYALGALEDVQMLLNVLTPIILVIIAAYTIDDVTNTWTRANVEIAQAQLQMVQYQVRLAMTEQPKTRAQTQED